MGDGDVSDMQSGGFDPDRGPFAAYFYVAVRNACLDVLRRRGTMPRPDAGVTDGELLLPDGGDLEDEILARLDHLQEKIAAAIEVLPLSDKHRDMLRLMLDTGEADPSANGKSSSAERQARRRLRHEVDKLANLTLEERHAASLVRRHHSVAAAADAAPDLDVRGLYASATRKVFALFGIEREDLK
jgi:DNA-directed RNA polymerase specialized sigma24 family protein